MKSPHTALTHASLASLLRRKRTLGVRWAAAERGLARCVLTNRFGGQQQKKRAPSQGQYERRGSLAMLNSCELSAESTIAVIEHRAMVETRIQIVELHAVVTRRDAGEECEGSKHYRNTSVDSDQTPAGGGFPAPPQMPDHGRDAQKRPAEIQRCVNLRHVLSEQQVPLYR